MYIYLYICIYIKKIEILNLCMTLTFFLKYINITKIKNLQKEQYI